MGIQIIFVRTPDQKLHEFTSLEASMTYAFNQTHTDKMCVLILQDGREFTMLQRPIAKVKTQEERKPGRVNYGS